MNRAERRRQAKQARATGADGAAANIAAAMAAALAHHRAGRLADAALLYHRVLKTVPGHADALHLAGVVAFQQGDAAAAVGLIARALALAPDVADYHSNLGNALAALGRSNEAIASYRRAVAADPGHAEAHMNLGITLAACGQTADAVAAYRRALEVRPRFPEALNNLGAALKDLGRADEAEAAYLHALEADPRHLGALNNLGIMRLDQGRPEEALTAARRAMALAPDRDEPWINLAQILGAIEVHGWDPVLEADVMACLGRDGVDHQHLARAAAGIVKADSEVSRLVALASNDGRAFEDAVDSGRAGRLLARPLLLALMEQTVIADESLERLLTRARRAWLAHLGGGGSGAGDAAFLLALARQCHVNEHIYAVDADEEAAAQDLAGDLVDDLNGAGEPSLETIARVAMAGCYGSLHVTGSAEALIATAGRSGDARFRALIEQQVLAPLEEARIAPTIPSRTTVRDVVSRAVQSQYEQNPYPRWLDVPAALPLPLGAVMRRAFPHMSEGRPTTESPRVLIAGCGTGRDAIAARRRFLGARVLALDLSRTSLAFAVRRTRELGHDDIAFEQGDILELSSAELPFDVIESGGVLHHMADPMAGWRRLAELLAPGGFMKIALYSEIARRPVAAARDLIAQRGHAATPEGIRRARAELLALGPEQAARRVTASLDFFALSPCRDLLFHVAEQGFTLPRVAAAIASLKLEFLGFEALPPGTLARYHRHFPEDARATDLTLWHRFEEENPDTFVTMYQFWLRKP